MKLKFVKKIQEAKGTFSFFFEPDQEVKWLPGQFYYYTLPNLKYEDSRGPTRHFTISSSPTEGSLLRVTTRIREESGYKKTLNELEIGTEIEGEGPSGTFIFDETEKNKTHVFLAGGIGITAFRVFIKYTEDLKYQTPMHLLYSNSLPSEIAFKEELEEWGKNLKNFKLAMTITKPEEAKEKWNGLKGRIDGNMVTDQLSKWDLALTEPTFWVVGPPGFTNAVEDMLSNLKVPSNHIVTEKFTGY